MVDEKIKNQSDLLKTCYSGVFGVAETAKIMSDFKKNSYDNAIKWKVSSVIEKKCCTHMEWNSTAVKKPYTS